MGSDLKYIHKLVLHNTHLTSSVEFGHAVIRLNRALCTNAVSYFCRGKVTEVYEVQEIYHLRPVSLLGLLKKGSLP